MFPPVRPRTRALLEAVEPRILYSADLAAVAGMVGGDAALAHEVRLQTPTATAGASTASTAVAHEIAFVDLGVPDAQTLISGLQAQRSAGRAIEVVTLAADEDGLAVITRTLAERQAQGDSFAAVHVFSHGRTGEVQIGAAMLDADSLLRRAGEIAGWGGALDAQADLMLYGCNVAADASGLFLIEGLAALTGADVAASDDLTGGVAQGGDWVLEQQTGSIDTRVAAEVALQQTWAGVLGNEIQVNTTTAGNQNTDAETRGSQQAVTLDAAGNFTVVWTSGGQDGGGKGVYARRFAFDGTALTGEIQVNVTTAKDQENARIVGDAAGNFAVVWTSQDQDGTTASVYFRRFAADGTALTGEIRANATDTGDQSNAAIAMNTGNGDVVVVWEGAGPTTGAVYFRRFAADGTALDAADCAVSTVGGEADPVVAMDATGRFVVAWGRADHMYFQRYDATGASAGSATQFDTFLSSSLEASIAMDSAGNFALAYGHTTTSNIKGIWCHAYFADGSSRGLWSNVDAATDAASASISLAADGSAVVVYQRAGDGAGNGIYARKIGPSGTVLGSDFLVNQSTDKEQVSASVAVHDTDRFVVVWSGDSSADKDGVYARTFEPVNSAPVITSNGGGGTAAVSVAENTTAVTTVAAADADWPVQTLAYTIIGGADQAKFSINPLSGALRFVAAPDFERPADADGNNVYDVVVQTNDGLLLGGTQTLSVTVTDANDQVTASPDTASTSYVTPVTVAVLSNDQRGLDPTLTLLEVTQPAHGKATLTGGQVVYTPDTGFVGTDTFQYRVVDGSEGLTHYWSLDGAGAVDAITGTAGSPQGAPTAVAGVNGQALQFDGVDDHVVLPDTAYTNEFTLSYWFKLADNHGTGYRYLYSHADALVQNSLNIYFIEDATTTAATQNVLRTSLIDSNDSTSLTSRASLDIDATLLADGRWHQYTLTTRTGVGSSVYIDGGLRTSSTQGGDAINPTGNVYLGVNDAVDALRRLDGALDDLQLLDHTTVAAQVALMPAGPGETATVTVAVSPVNTETPVIVSDGGGLNAVLNVVENSTAITVVSATDADVPTPTLTYSIIGGTDQALFAVDSLSGAVSFLAAQDFEHPASAGSSNTYEVIVQASDGVHADAQTLKVFVTDANEYGVGPILDQDAVADAVDENVAIGTTVGLTVQAVDPDGTGNTVTYALDDSAGGLFAIDSVSGVVKVAGALDAEAATSRNLIVRATSADGSSLTHTYTIAVRDLDEFDVTVPADVNAAANTVREDAEVGDTVGLTVTATDADATSNTITYSLTNSAGGRFAINATTGVVTVASALDAETAMSHTIAVRATSADGSVSGLTFTIAVQDDNEFDIDSVSDIDPASATVREDATIGTPVGVQAHAVDPDATNNAVTYSLSYNSSGRFSINATSGVITVAGALNAESSLLHLVAIRATSSDGSSETKWVSITVQDADEFDVTTPVDQNSGANTVTNIASVGSTVGITASADDADVSLNQVTYTLDDDASGRFAVGSSSGVVTLARSVTADADTVQTLVLRATSADGSVATQTFSVAITRANLYAPVITSDGGGVTAAVTVLENTTAVTTVIATDADVSPGARTYTITGGADAALFTIDPVSGVLRFAAAPDAEHPLDVGGNSAHEVVVLASDGVRFDTQTLTVTVADVNDAVVTTPVDVDAAVDSVLENAAIGTWVGVTASAIDTDATNHSVTYTLDNSAGGRFAIDASTGVVTVAGLLDAETALSHTLVVRATSADGSTATQTWTVAV